MYNRRMQIFLSGMMATGKSSAGHMLASRLQLPFVDTDAVIETRSALSVQAIFSSEGEEGFRRRERHLVEELLTHPVPRVVALGGGALLDAQLRHRVLRAATVITLAASAEELLRRLQSDATDRPLLANLSLGRVEHVLQQRSAAYAESHGQIDTDELTPAEVVSRIMVLLEVPTIVVPLGTRTYPVRVKSGALRRVAAEMPDASTSSTLLITDEHVGPSWAASVEDSLKTAGIQAERLLLPAGEEHKNADTVQRIWDVALEHQVTRSSWLLSLGGGVVGDLTGFCASTLLRGLRVGHMPTSLLAMVDSAVGGKTGFDTRHGKNLIGTFHQPSFVICDPNVLATLPERDYRSGLAEVVKSLWLCGDAEFAELEARALQLLARDATSLEWTIRSCVTFKAAIVTADEQESTGERMLLNLGHTFGHALEAAAKYQGLLHGEAVSLGIVAACAVSMGLGEMEAEQARRVVNLLDALQLPVQLDDRELETAEGFLRADKKRAGSEINFILPRAAGHNQVLKLPVDELLPLLRRGIKHLPQRA